MEESTANTGNKPVSKIDALKQKLRSYKEEQSAKTKSKPTPEEIRARYFTPRKETEYFRIIPSYNNPDELVEKAFFHTVKINGQWRKIYCPERNDPDVDGKSPHCPLCAKSRSYLEQQDDSLKGIKREDYTEAQKIIDSDNKELYKKSKSWEAKKFYIVRGIDRNAQGDGVKFWRFKDNYKKEGVFDKLQPAMNFFIENFEEDFRDELNGVDFTISTVETNRPGTNFTYRTVSSIQTRPKQSPLHEEETIRKEWINDPTTWRDVYKPAEAPNVNANEFMSMIALSDDVSKVYTAPYFDDTDSKNKHWVFPNRPDLEEMANTRNRDLGANTSNKTVEKASDLQSAASGVVNESYQPSINSITKDQTGTYTDTDVVDLSQDDNSAQAPDNELETQNTQDVSSEQELSNDEAVDQDIEDEIDKQVDDLPF